MLRREVYMLLRILPAHGKLVLLDAALSLYNR